MDKDLEASEYIDRAADSLRGLMKLLDDGDLVRNTDGDGDAMVFLRQGVRITNALKAAQDALESEKSANAKISGEKKGNQ